MVRGDTNTLCSRLLTKRDEVLRDLYPECTDLFVYRAELRVQFDAPLIECRDDSHRHHAALDYLPPTDYERIQ